MAVETLVKSPAVESDTLRLAGRVTYDVDRQTAAAAQQLGYEEFLEWQLDYERIDDSQLENGLRQALPTLSMDATELREYLRGQEDPGAAQRELRAATLVRQAFSPRQLYERMVEFWSDHFNVTVNSAASAYLKPVEDREVIRPLAMGRFPDLLQADAASPAMLYYLDNHTSTADGPNENYARELMELHTLGVDGGYSEADVKDAARVFTGWSISRHGEYVFRAFRHDYGEKTVLGEQFPSGAGRSEGERLLDLLAAHPSTAQHLARKLAVRFVADQPAPEVITDVAEAFSLSGGDIRETLRTLLLHPQVRSAPAAKLKRPNEFVAGLVRKLEVEPGEAVILAVFRALEASGQVPFQWPAPNGYPDFRTYWQSSVGFLVRFNTATTWTRAAAGFSPLLQEATTIREARQQVRFLAAALVPQGLELAAIELISSHAAGLHWRQRPAEIAALLLAGPANQWR